MIMGDINDDVLNNSHRGIIELRCVRAYLTKNHILFLINTITDELLNKDNSSIYELSDKDNYKNFKESLKKHFQWMIDRTYKQIDFDDTYMSKDISNNFAYCAFYQKLSLIVSKIEDSEIQKYMNHYCVGFKNKYFC